MTIIIKDPDGKEKTITIEAPPGSKITLDPGGNISIQLPSPSGPNPGANPPKSPEKPKDPLDPIGKFIGIINGLLSFFKAVFKF